MSVEDYSLDGYSTGPGGAGRRMIGRAAAVIMLATIVGRLLGLVRDQVTAFYFGAGAGTDAFFLAYKIPYLLWLTVGGALTATFVPVFTQRWVAGDRERAWRLSTSMMNAIALILTAVVVVLAIAAPWVIPLVGWGFDEATADRAVFLFRLLLPSAIFMGILGLVTGVLNARKKFAAPAFATSLAAAVAILFMVLFADSWGLSSIAVGTTIGSFAALAILFPPMIRGGMRYTPRIDWSLPGMREVGMLIWPIFLGSAAGKVSIFADQVLASTLETGSISALNYAEKMFRLPLGLFVAGITIPIFPLLSEHVAAARMDRLKDTVNFGLRLIAFIMLPATVGLIVLRGPIVSLLFEHGAFLAEDTERTAWALLFYALGLLGYAGRDTLTRVFYAYHDTRTPVKTSVAAVVLNVVASIVLMQFLGVGGLALGTTLAMSFNMVVLMELLRRRLGPMGFGSFGRSAARTLAGAVVMGAAVWGVDAALALRLDAGSAALGLRVAVGIAVGVAVFTGAAAALRMAEVGEIKEMVSSVVRRGEGPGERSPDREREDT